MAPQAKNKRKRSADTDLDDEEYREKRDKNNLAVKRSGDKAKQKTKQTTPQGKNERKRRADADLDDEEYRMKRDKNNLAVKRSRERTRQKTIQTQERVDQLKSENETLEEKINMLTKELNFLKTWFFTFVNSNNGHNLNGIDLSALLQENSPAATWDLINSPEFKLSKN